MEYQIVAVKIGNRENTAVQVQKILTQYGCLIKVRLGLHDQPADACSPLGLLLLQVSGAKEEISAMVSALTGVQDAAVKSFSL